MSRSQTRTSWARTACRLLGTAALAALFSPTIASAADTVQDFSAIFSPPPPPTPIAFSGQAHFEPGSLTATPGGSFARITDDTIANNGAIGLSQFAGQVGAYNSLTFDFDFRVNDPATGADGFGFHYLPVSSNGIAGASPIIGEEPNLPGALGIGFDTWNNDDATDGTDTGLGGVDGSLPDSFSLHYNGARLASVSVLNPSVALPADWLENGNTKHATITVTPSGGNANVHLLVTEPSTGLNAQPFGATGMTVTGFTPYDGRVGFSGRVGGENQNQEIDNVVATFVPTGGGGPIVGTQNFDTPNPPPPPAPTILGGTPFAAQTHGSAPGGSVEATFGVPPGGGGADGHYQLTPNVGSNLNSIAFDKTFGTLHAGDQIVGSFDIRVQDLNGATADGMSFLLLDTNTYGSTGPLAVGVNVSEDPNNPGSVALGFDTFDNDEDFPAGDPNGCGGPGPNDCNVNTTHERRANSISAHVNGTQIDQQFLPNVFYEDGNWIHVDVALSVLDNGVGGLGGFMDVIVTDTLTGQTFPAFAGLPIASIPENLRIAFGGRTGGEMDIESLDNVNFQQIQVPEPSTFVLLGLAGVGLYWNRRRK